MNNWRKFQDQVADIFSALGAEVFVEQKVQGARGTHKSDVLVQFFQYGLRVRWIIECKFWESLVPKEKGLALQAIVSDTGVDKGLLISNVGFQSGAVRAARNTNVALYTLEELTDFTISDMSKAVLERLELKGVSLRRELLKLTVRLDDGSVPSLRRFWTPNGATQAIGMLQVLQRGFECAKLETPPYPYPHGEDKEFAQASEIEEFIQKAKEVLSVAESVFQHAKQLPCDLER